MNKYAKAALRPFVPAGARLLARTFQHAVTPEGYLMRVNGRYTHPLDYVGLWMGRYEEAERQILTQNFKPAQTIIEIGANIGYVARVAIDNKLAEDGHYIAVEPNPRSEQPLLVNLRRSMKKHPRQTFTFVSAAVDAPELTRPAGTFVMRPNLSSGLPMHTSSGNLGRETKVQVAITSLSEILKKHAPNGASLICDAEGAEIDMILKDGDAFKKIDQMSIEFHDKSVTGRDVDAAQLLPVLQKMGFTVGAKVANTFYLSRSPA